MPPMSRRNGRSIWWARCIWHLPVQSAGGFFDDERIQPVQRQLSQSESVRSCNTQLSQLIQRQDRPGGEGHSDRASEQRALFNQAAQLYFWTIPPINYHLRAAEADGGARRRSQEHLPVQHRRKQLKLQRYEAAIIYFEQYLTTPDADVAAATEH